LGTKLLKDLVTPENASVRIVVNVMVVNVHCLMQPLVDEKFC